MKDVSLQRELYAVLNNKIEDLKEQIRLKDVINKELTKIIEQQETIIKSLVLAIKTPKYKRKDIVSIVGEGDERYTVEGCSSYFPVYTLTSIIDNSVRESILECEIV
jgi:hypothetical protein